MPTSKLPIPLLAIASLLLLPAHPEAARAEAPRGVEVRTLAGPFDGAVGGVAVDQLGFVYVADFGEKVWKLAPTGELRVFANSLYGASGNTIAPGGELLQSEFYAGRVTRIARDGATEVVASGLAGPVGVAATVGGELFVCECRANRIARVDAAGNVSRFAESELFNCPNGLASGADGRLFVANFNDGRVLAVAPDGAVSLLATIPGGGNGHLARVGDDLYVTAFRANRIYRIGAGGEVEPFAGTGTFGQGDGPAESALFATPNGIAYASGRDALYVNDHLSTWAERFEGRTSPRSTVREILFPTLEQVAAGAFADGNPEAVRTAVLDYVRARSGRPFEPILNRLGYARLAAGRTAEAIAVFEAATELFPASFNPWDSLAEARLAAGDRTGAIRDYQKSLELNPENRNATAKLRELGVD